MTRVAVPAVGLTTDARGQISVAISQQIHVFDQQEVSVGVIAGARVTPDQTIQLQHLAISPDQVLYVSDAPNHRVQVFRLLHP